MKLINSLLFVQQLSPLQLTIVILLGVLFITLIAGNVWLFLFLRKRSVHKLCTHKLQNKRDELMQQLNLLREGVFVSAGVEAEEDEEEEEADEMLLVDEEDGDDSEDGEIAASYAEPQNFDVVTQEEVDETFAAEILYVSKTSAEARQKLGFAGAEFNGKRYYVRYNLGFDAKLRLSSDEVKERYVALMNEIAMYQGLKVKASYKQLRVYKGRKTLMLIVFRGKTLCVAFALNPADYEETKFRGIDKSDSRRFEKTPMFMKLTSQRRLDYSKYLLVQLAEDNNLMPLAQPEQLTFDLAEKPREELFIENKLQITVLGEVPDSVPYEQPEPEEEEIDEDELESGVSVEELKRYNRSYTARLIQADDELKARYSEIKNHIVAYRGVFNGITWKREAFYITKRDCVATFAIRGKTLCLFLAVPASKFEGTKYRVEDRTQQVRKAKMPTMFRIRSDRGTKYAKELIDIVLSEKGIKINEDYKPVNFRPTYRSTENLIRGGHIKVKTTQVTVEETPAKQPAKRSAGKSSGAKSTKKTAAKKPDVAQNEVAATSVQEETATDGNK